MSRRKRKAPPVKTLVDLILPVYGQFDFLQRSLDCLPEAFGDIPYQVILVDDNSPEENTASFYRELKKEHPEYIIYQSKINNGFPKGCNIGVRKGRSPLVFLLNTDCFMDSGSGIELVKSMDNPDVGIVGMKLRFPGEEMQAQRQLPSGELSRTYDKLQHVGLSISISRNVHHMFLGWDVENKKVKAVEDVIAVTGAALMTRRAIWKQIGGLWEGYGLGTYEDVEFSLAVQELGKRVIINQDATGIHFAGGSAEKYKVAFPLNKNNFLFQQRWGDKMRWMDWIHYGQNTARE